MTEPDQHPDRPLTDSRATPHPLEYGRQSRKRPEPTPEEQCRILLCGVAIAFLATFAWWFTMFGTRRPALHYFFICAFLPGILAFIWLTLGCKLLILMRRHPQLHRRRLIALMLLAFFLAPYSLRAGPDMFTFSVHYHLWRAGGADQVRAAFNQWVASQPVFHPGSGEKLLFHQLTPGGNIVPLPATQLPKEVRYIHDKFPSTFGTTLNDVAHLHSVSVFTTTDIMIGPPGWQPNGGATFWGLITGNRRKVADGIWIEFGLYNK